MSDVIKDVTETGPAQQNIDEPPKVVTEKKPDPPKPVEKKPDPPKVVEKKSNTVERELKYKLNLYTATGTVNSTFNGAVIYDVSRRFGDIMRAISPIRFMTEDEICSSVWTIEKKMRHPNNRTRKQVREALEELISRQMVITN